MSDTTFLSVCPCVENDSFGHFQLASVFDVSIAVQLYHGKTAKNTLLKKIVMKLIWFATCIIARFNLVNNTTTHL